MVGGVSAFLRNSNSEATTTRYLRRAPLRENQHLQTAASVLAFSTTLTPVPGRGGGACQAPGGLEP